jgi:AcrR family transcriptional regulator
MVRATPLSPDDRRKAIIDVTIPLLREHGRETTTKQVAEAAGIAEGTIFRVFESKHELFLQALETAFDPHDFLDLLDQIDTDLPLRDKLVQIATLYQERFTGTFELMSKMGMVQPPQAIKHGSEWRERAREVSTRLVAANSGELRIEPYEVVRAVRLLTFSGSHPHISDGRILTPDEIVDIVLNGTLISTAKETH